MPNSGKVGEPYKQIVGSMDDVAFVVNGDMTIRFANQAAVAYANSSLEEIQGTSIEPVAKQMAAEEEDPERFIQAARALLRGDEPEAGTYVQGPQGTGTFSLEFELSFEDREHVVADQRIKPVEFKDGSRGLCVISRDITARKEKQRELEQFKEAVENAGHSIFITDTDGTIKYVNPAFEKISGYSADVATGANPAILKSGEHGEELYENLWNTILDGRTWENELVNEAKSGERYVIDQTISPITDENDNVEKFVAVNTDITERKRRKQVIEVLNRVLRHNLRNDLNIVSGIADLIIRDRVETLGDIRQGIESVAEDLPDSGGESGGEDRGDAQRRQLKQIIRSLDSLAEHIQMDGQRAKETAQGLFDIAEKASEVQAMLKEDGTRFTQKDLSEVLEEVKSELDEIYPEAEFSIETLDSVSVRVNRHLETAIRELLENAIEHNDSPTPMVNMSMRLPEAKALEIEFSDNGPGIPEEERQVLNEGVESPLLHGSGMGLWLVYWAITMAGGTLAIDGKEPHGSIITLTLPTGSDRIEVNRTEENEDF